jgi:hypothetical protein
MKPRFAFVLVLCCIADVCARAADNVLAPLVYIGAVDGSAAVALDAEHFVAASDEDSILRVYCRVGYCRRWRYGRFQTTSDVNTNN